MDYSKCSLYMIKTFSDLEKILGKGIYHYKKGQQGKNYKIKIDKTNGKGRLIEAPTYNLKLLQQNILNELKAIPLPEYYFSKQGSNNIKKTITFQLLLLVLLSFLS